ncbi:MAG TPA: SurA N-terminal domain-containing protein [Terriglobales bacterium]|jgi:peptidyl-prolyl cis-trans isomerase SurA|nr:SurA N-terminal domain-containing protein [Terriglobales bacterium]
MPKKLLHFGLVILLTAACAYAGNIIDRIVATVNGHIILQSDWDEALSYEAFVNGRPLNQVTLEDRKAALDRLIDQELIRQQIHPADFRHPSAADVDRRIEDIRKEHSEVVDELTWKAALQLCGLSESELRQKVTAELEEMRMVDAHLRPSVQVDARSVESYYRDKLLPELRASGAKEVSLIEVAPKIKELLAQQKMNDLLITWLRSLRAESSIRTPFQSSGIGGGGLE